MTFYVSIYLFFRVCMVLNPKVYLKKSLKLILQNLNYTYFLEVVSFVFDGGYILNNYNKWTKLKKDSHNIYRVNDENNKEIL